MKSSQCSTLVISKFVRYWFNYDWISMWFTNKSWERLLRPTTAPGKGGKRSKIVSNSNEIVVIRYHRIQNSLYYLSNYHQPWDPWTRLVTILSHRNKIKPNQSEELTPSWDKTKLLMFAKQTNKKCCNQFETWKVNVGYWRISFRSQNSSPS